jgi:aspartyl-tRNA(Asn)/glutamyl-tRNA(Gln) amidotransferase subunit A
VNLNNATITELHRLLTDKAISATELTQHFLSRIAENDSEINSFITITPEVAIEEAKAADLVLAKGQHTMLTGIPMAHKDIFCIEDIRTTAGSKILADFIAPYTATCIAKLRHAGTVTLGKTNMDEFAMGSSNESSYFGPVHNPWDKTKVPGGSSGGSAASLAACLCVASTGTDTGGSIRQPASMCGLTGLKPTYGRISRWGMIAFASSLDQAGCFTRTAEDAAILLEHMAGHDSKDSTSLNLAVPEFTAALSEPLAGLKVGICSDYFKEGLEPEVENLVMDGIKELAKMGAKVVEIELPHTKFSLSAYYVIAPAECSANLSRYDGVRYGYRCKDPKNLEDLYKRSRSEGFGSEVKKRIMVGTFALSAGYYDAYYRKAQQLRRLIKNDFVSAFEQVDVIVGPTAPGTAFPLGAKTNDPVSMYLQDIYTIAASLAGVPAISIPVGLSKGMPVGLQLIGNYLEEAKLLRVAHQFQQQTNWHQQQPQSSLS